MMIKSILTEYGIPWAFNRLLYSVKLKMMKILPATESLFEKEVNIERTDIFDIDVVKIENFLKEVSVADKKRIIQIADNAIEGKIKGFSSIELDYGYPINWHINPITGVVVDKNTKWYMIPDFDSARGDIKVIWEASRFTHFFYFARAYMISKDIKYYEAYSYQLDNWLKENLYSYGANYKCGQEATLRMINAIITFSVFKAYGLTEVHDEANLKELIDGSYKKVLSNFFYAHKCIKNNHTLSEITGLIIGAWCSKNNAHLKKAYQLMDKEIEKQFMNDGGYIQYSFNYQRFALQIMEFVLKISSKTGVELSKYSIELIKKSALLLYQLQEEMGDVPNYGANDGALIFPVTTSEYRDFRPVINTICVLTQSERVYEHGNYDEEVLWFSDKKLDDFKYLIMTRKSISFIDSGLYSIRHQDGFLMIVLQKFKKRPTQMDQLHIDLWYKGVNVLCDSGTYSYATDIGKLMALTTAHNTVMVENIEQMKKHGTFFIYDWTEAKDIECNTNSFKGTMISKNGYTHKRSIRKTNQGYFLFDEVNGNGEYCYFNFHTPCKVKINNEGFQLINNGKNICSIKTKGHIEVTKTHRSLYYLRTDEINCVSVRYKTVNNKCNADFSIVLHD